MGAKVTSRDASAHLGPGRPHEPAAAHGVLCFPQGQSRPIARWVPSMAGYGRCLGVGPPPPSPPLPVGTKVLPEGPLRLTP